MAGPSQNRSGSPARFFGRLPAHAASRLSMRAALESQDDIATTLLSVRSDSRGLTDGQALRRRSRRGSNRIPLPGTRSRRSVLIAALTDLQSLTLLLLAVIALLIDTANLPGVLLIVVIAMLSVLGALVRNRQNRRAAAALNELAATSTSVLRRKASDDEPALQSLPSSELVSGDIVQLVAGFRVPADVRLIEVNELYVDQSLLTGDTAPVRKSVGGREERGPRVSSKRFDPTSLPNIALTGCFVLSGTGTGVVVATGEQSYFGSLARALLHDNGLAWEVQFGSQNFLPRLVLLVPVAVLLRFGYAQGSGWQLALLGLAAVLYLLPELLPGLFLPRVVRPERERGALSSLADWLQLLRRKDDGQPRERFADADVELVAYLDAGGNSSPAFLQRAWVLSQLNTASLTSLDGAVNRYVEEHPELGLQQDAQLLDELPFDLRRQRYSLVVAGAHGQQMLISRGNPESLLRVAEDVRLGAERKELDAATRNELEQLIRGQLIKGNFVQLVGCRFIPPNRAKRLYRPADEHSLTIEGLLVFRADVTETDENSD